jgi:hypothetical protein
MKPQETARKLMAQERREAEQVEEKMLERAEEELAAGTADPELEEQARELLSIKRQQEQALEDKMLSRAEEELQSQE